MEIQPLTLRFEIFNMAPDSTQKKSVMLKAGADQTGTTGRNDTPRLKTDPTVCHRQKKNSA
ncbi:hypothetical protein Cflav_PD2081 [Pedosphaera parvula Ellin514]|uniref:Uncharacterized protein n=1 Tax=Pedosphaera parvula (strain Ellin514) TaxID=320771 RepID=B9XLI2_PEDPL|nr:hypothetical protein Cflav_PD2081 [Pedosphaera parvula Ellin514]